MLKRILSVIIIFCGVLLIARAQDATPSPEPEREIYTALGYGDGVFEPDIWYASAAEEPTRTTATWRADGIGGVGFVEYLHFDEGVKFSQFNAVFNDDWFKTTLSNYKVWRENTHCDQGDLRLIDF